MFRFDPIMPLAMSVGEINVPVGTLPTFYHPLDLANFTYLNQEVLYHY